MPSGVYARTRKDETGNVFGRLTVVAQAPNKGPHSMWRCRCECGNEIETLGFSLRGGNTRSCGCLRAERAFERIALPTGVGALNRAIYQMQRNAVTRHLEWHLSREETLLLMAQDCHYCGEPPSNLVRGRNGDSRYNGIDRVDSNVGYMPWNVVPCCFTCNHSKRDMSYTRFTSWIEKAYLHLNKQRS